MWIFDGSFVEDRSLCVGTLQMSLPFLKELPPLEKETITAPYQSHRFGPKYLRNLFLISCSFETRVRSIVSRVSQRIGILKLGCKGFSARCILLAGFVLIRFLHFWTIDVGWPSCVCSTRSIITRCTACAALCFS